MTALSWVGLGVDDDQDTALNWLPAQVPIAGDSLDYPAGADGACNWNMNLAFLGLTFDPASQIDITQSAEAIFASGNFTVDGTGGSTWDQNGFAIEAAGYSDIGSAVKFRSSNVFRATGASSTTMVSTGNDVSHVAITKPGGMLQLVDGFDILGSIQMDSSGGNQTIKSSTSLSININKIIITGQTSGGFKTTFGDAFNVMTIVITDSSGLKEFVDFENIVISGTPIFANADNSTIDGGTVGVTLIAVDVWDDTGPDSLMSTGDNWVSGFTPIPETPVRFNATSVANATNDLASLGGLEQEAAYTGIVTQSLVLATFLGSMLLNGGAASRYDVDGNQADIKNELTSGAATNGIHATVAGSRVRVGGKSDLDNANFGGVGILELVDFIGGGRVDHDFRLNIGSGQLPDFVIIRNNNRMVVITSSTIDNGTVDDGGSIRNQAGQVRTLTTRGVLTIAALVGAILSDVPGNFTMAYNAGTAPGGDYGTANLQTTSSIRVIPDDPVANAQELKAYRTFVTGPGGLDVAVDCAFVVANIGSPTNDGINGDVIVRSGKLFVASLSCSINETDGVQICQLVFETGALAPILGTLVAEALTNLDFNANTFTIPVLTDVLIDATCTADFGLTLVDVLGTGDIKNQTTGNRFYSLAIAALGEITTAVEEVEVEGGFLSFKGGTYDFGGFTTRVQGQGAQFVGADITTLIGTGAVALGLEGDMTIPGADFTGINFTITAQNVGAKLLTLLGVGVHGSTFIATAADRLITVRQSAKHTMGFFNHGFSGESAIWDLNGNTLIGGTHRFNGPLSGLIGPGEATFDKLIVDDGTLKLTDVNYDSLGTVDVAAGKTIDLDNGELRARGKLTLLGILDFGPSGRLYLEDDADFSDAGAVVTPDGGIIILSGGANQIIDCGGKTMPPFKNEKSGGTVTFLTALTSPKYISRPQGNINTDFQVGVVFTIAEFDLANLGPFKDTIDSTDSLTAVALTNTGVGPVGRNTDVGRMTLAVGTQDMDSATCSDLGGNNVNWNFAALPADGVLRSVLRSVNKGVLRPVVGAILFAACLFGWWSN